MEDNLVRIYVLKQDWKCIFEGVTEEEADDSDALNPISQSESLSFKEYPVWCYVELHRKSDGERESLFGRLLLKFTRTKTTRIALC